MNCRGGEDSENKKHGIKMTNLKRVTSRALSQAACPIYAPMTTVMRVYGLLREVLVWPRPGVTTPRGSTRTVTV